MSGHRCRAKGCANIFIGKHHANSRSKGAWRLESSFGLTISEGSLAKAPEAKGPLHYFQVFQNGEAKFIVDVAMVPMASDNTAEMRDFYGDWLKNPPADWSLSGRTGFDCSLGFHLNDDDMMEGDEVFEVRVFARLSGWAFGDTPALRATITIRDDDVNGSELADALVGTGYDEYLRGYGVNDTLRAGLGQDYLLGGFGDDHLYGDGGNDTLDGVRAAMC